MAKRRVPREIMAPPKNLLRRIAGEPEVIAEKCRICEKPIEPGERHALDGMAHTNCALGEQDRDEFLR